MPNIFPTDVLYALLDARYMAIGVTSFATKALMDAALNYEAGFVAFVTNDTTPANNTTYRKTGASGTGSWVQSSMTAVEVNTKALSRQNLLVGSSLKNTRISLSGGAGAIEAYFQQQGSGVVGDMAYVTGASIPNNFYPGGFQALVRVGTRINLDISWAINQGVYSAFGGASGGVFIHCTDWNAISTSASVAMRQDNPSTTLGTFVGVAIPGTNWKFFSAKNFQVAGTAVLLKMGIYLNNTVGSAPVTCTVVNPAVVYGPSIDQLLYQSTLDTDIDALVTRATTVEGRATALEGRATALEGNVDPRNNRNLIPLSSLRKTAILLTDNYPPLTGEMYFQTNNGSGLLADLSLATGANVPDSLAPYAMKALVRVGCRVNFVAAQANIKQPLYASYGALSAGVFVHCTNWGALGVLTATAVQDNPSVSIGTFTYVSIPNTNWRYYSTANKAYASTASYIKFGVYCDNIAGSADVTCTIVNPAILFGKAIVPGFYSSDDDNFIENIEANVTTLQGQISTAQGQITTLQNATTFDPNFAINQNLALNPLFLKDTVGYTGVPTSYMRASGGANSVLAATEIVTKSTPFGTNQCLRISNYKDATYHSDLQLKQNIVVPLAYRGNAATVCNFVIHVYLETAYISVGDMYVNIFDINGTELTGFYVSKSSPATIPLNTWTPVVYSIPLTNVNIARINAGFRMNGDYNGTYPIHSNSYGYAAGFTVDFNRTNIKTFERGTQLIADEAAAAAVAAHVAATAGITPRTTVNNYDQWLDSRNNIAPLLPIGEIVCWGDSLTAAEYPGYLATRFTSPVRTVKNHGIGGETSIEILNRIKGHDANTAGITWTPGTIRLKTKRTVPPREILEAYRAQWGDFGIRVGEPKKVEFFNATGLIGTTRLQLKAAATVSGTRVTAASNPFVNGDEVYHLGTVPSGMYAGKVYYVRDQDSGGYSLAEYTGGAAISFGSGSVTTLGPFYYDWAYTSQDHTITTVTHTDKDCSNAILWMGANNIASTAQVKADIKAAFEHMKTFAKRVVVLTCIGNSTDIVGTGNYNSLTAINAWILEEYPNNCVDVYSYLRSKYNTGLPQDVTDYNNGITPGSLRIDAIHLTSAGYNHVADAVYAFLNTRGW